MRSLKLQQLSIYFAGLLMFSACSSDKFAEEPVVAPDESSLYIRFELSQFNVTPTPAESKETRAGDADLPLDKTKQECRINSLIALMVDGEGANKGDIVGIARPEGYQIVPKEKDGNVYGAYTVTANMGLASFYKRQHTYRLYIFANLEEGTYSILDATIGSKIENVCRDINKGETGMKPILPANLNKETGYETLKFSTLEADVIKVKVWLEENGSYSSENPYILKTDAGNADGVLMLTPLQSCFYFHDLSGGNNFTYPVDYSTDDSGSKMTEVKVQFKKAQLVNAAQKEYLLPQGSESSFTLSSPSSPGFISSSKFDIKEGKALYVPEFIPAVTANKLTYSATTYMMLDGILVADAQCTALDANVRNEISSGSSAHRPLYYYDDGKYQSGLTLVSHEGEANWKKLTYDSTLGGYKVTYYHAIRHNAGTGKNLEDGTVYPLEYGVVRNYIYQIGVNSVSALPHSFSPTDNVESDKKDINIRINPPAKWTYHRGGSVIVFE